MEMVKYRENFQRNRLLFLWLFRGTLLLAFLIDGKEFAKVDDSELKTLGFVFDVTGSMHDDWQGAINGGKRILQEFLTLKTRPVKNYVLVPFSDPDIGPVTATENSNLFLSDLNKLVIGGGGDCPEMALTGIKKALELSYPYSYLYVFTDASAKDYGMANEVIQLIERKHTQIVFFITGHCEDADSEPFLVYEKLAASSLGQMYYLLKSDVNDVLKSVLVTTKPNKSNLLVVSSPKLDSKNSAKFNISVENGLKEMILEIAGNAPEVEIKNPLGYAPDHITIPFHLPNNKLILIEHPKPAGNWVLKVTFHPEKSKNPVTPLITAKGVGSSFDIQNGFSLNPPNVLSDTAYRPMEGNRNYVYMEIHPTKDTVENKDLLKKHRWTSVDFTRQNGDIVQSLPLDYIIPGVGEDIFPRKFRGGPFTPPNGLFNLAFRGFDENDNPITRLTFNFISAEEASAPFVKMESSFKGVKGMDLKLQCDVESLITFSLQWYKDGAPIGGEKKYAQSSDASLILSNVKEKDAGQYKCEAKNSRGSNSLSTYVTVIALPEISGMDETQLIVTEGDSIILNCVVTSKLAYDTKWIYKHDGKEEDITSLLSAGSGIQILPNNSLSLSSLKRSESGIYICRATNEAGPVEKETEVVITSKAEVTISPDHDFEFLEGEKILMDCNVQCKTKTKVHWEFNGAQVGASKEITSDDKVPLVLPSANKGWDGVYVCIAENDAGQVQKEIRGTFIELPEVKIPSPYLAVKNGGTAILQCSFSGTPTPSITWLKEGHPIVNGIKHQLSPDQSSLTILNADLSDEGVYRCTAKGPRNSESTGEIKLRIGTPPKPRQSFTSGSLKISTGGIFPCEAQHDPESDLFPGMKTKITWEKANGTLNFARQKVLTSGELKIADAKIIDSGKYICKLSNSFGEEEMVLDLNIVGAVVPSIVASNDEDIIYKNGEDIVLTCDATGVPPPKILWTFRSKTSLRGIKKLKDGYEQKDVIRVSGKKLTLYRVNKNFQGIYSCAAVSDAGHSPKSKDFNLRMRAPPSFINDSLPNKATIKKGEDYSFFCNADGVPKPKLSWVKDNKYAVNDIKGVFKLEKDKSVLKILSARPGYHNGIYKCIASNSAKKAYKKFTLNVEK